MRMPGLRLRIGLAVVVIAASAAWLIHHRYPSDLLSVKFRPVGVNITGLPGDPRVRGYADANGQLKHRLAWEKLSLEVELVPVRQGQLWGYMNRRNAWVVKPQYSVAEVFHPDGVGVVTLDNKKGAINRLGQLIVPCDFDILYSGSHQGIMYV